MPTVGPPEPAVRPLFELTLDGFPCRSSAPAARQRSSHPPSSPGHRATNRSLPADRRLGLLLSDARLLCLSDAGPGPSRDSTAPALPLRRSSGLEEISSRGLRTIARASLVRKSVSHRVR